MKYKIPNFFTKEVLLIILLAFILLFSVPFFVSGKWLPFNPPSDEDLRIKYLEQYIKLMQLIVVVFVSAIIPNLISQARYRFEQYKESRLAYSRAKTAVVYLQDKVLNVDDLEKAFLLVEKAHRDLHFAETFENMIIKQGYLGWFDNPKLWITYNYWRIAAVAEVLREFELSDEPANDFKNKKKLQEKLKRASDVVEERFGEQRNKVEDKHWYISNPCRSKKETKLLKDIRKEIEEKAEKSDNRGN